MTPYSTVNQILDRAVWTHGCRNLDGMALRGIKQENILKTMTCNQLGGACDLEFRAETFEEMEELSKSHGMEMFKANDAAHLEAMQKIKALMTTPGAMEEWFEARRSEFEALPHE